ncbi:MAG: type IVB secretion system protein IcmH/DotU [Saezia sp.]
MNQQTNNPYYNSPKHGSSDHLIREPKKPSLSHKEQITFNTVHQIDQDSDLWFQLRGYGYNILIDVAQPLFGLVMRIRQLRTSPDTNIESLYNTVRQQIATIDDEIARNNYDNATLLAYRYCLCSFIDEAVMGTPWGAQSIWAERSLLSTYHNETWGGEKFFTILSRMMLDPEKYRDVLEFMYLCLCLGFKGRYGVQVNSNDELQNIITKLHKTLRQMRGETPEWINQAYKNIAPSHIKIGSQWPWWSPWAAAAVLLVVGFIIYSVILDGTTNNVLKGLSELLKR